MAGGDNPLLLSEMMSQGFEQTRKAMQTYAELFQKNMKASPLFNAGLNKRTTYIEKNIAAAIEFIQKVSQAKDVPSLWQIQADFIQTHWKNYIEDIRETAPKDVPPR